MSRENEFFCGGQGRSARSVREDGESMLVFFALGVAATVLLALLA
jgi:hypothetical protein